MTKRFSVVLIFILIAIFGGSNIMAVVSSNNSEQQTQVPKKMVKLLPDLRITMGVSPNAPGKKSVVIVMVHNDGRAKTELTVNYRLLLYYYGEDGKQEPSTYLKERIGQVFNIEPGKKQVETFDYVFQHEGMYKIVARVDHLFVLEESDETNNSYQLNVWVKD